ncbi:MAG TPA: sulfatase/phosphatase domain-containing protein, partial [Acidobacteriota bacterium]|nr:sulfatase/phosphatase domain-containing protein [Acidobacteriota bacterium]
TLVIVTSDNGMSFPRAKANLYEYGIHVPLAIQWPKRIPPGRTINDLVSLVDLAPTILEITGIEHTGRFPMTGRSILSILLSEEEGVIDPSRNGVYSGRERHSSSRYENMGYPARAVRTEEYLYIRNFAPERWPAGDPQKYEEDGTLGPMHGAYHDIDPAPSLTLLVEGADDPELSEYLTLAVAKRPAEELYRIVDDPECLYNLAKSDEHQGILRKLRQQLERYLTETGDPRMGSNGEVFETYPRYSPIRLFPPPE